MTHDVFLVLTIFVNHMLRDKFIQYRVFFTIRNNNLNDIVYIVLSDVVIEMSNNQNVRMKKISFLKFNNICMSFYLLKHMTFSQISQQFLLKHTNDQIRLIFSRYTRRKISFEFRSIEIANKNKKER